MPLSLIRLLPDKELLVGAIDVATDTRRDARGRSPARIARSARSTPTPSASSACTNCGMAPLSRDVAVGKLRALGAGVQLMRKGARF